MAQENILKVAHRGASGYEPENTLLAFQKAIELNADMIELDTRVCESGELVVMHDDSVDRTTNGKGKIEDKTLKELKSLDESRAQKIPTLIEVLDFIDKRIKLNIELKDEGTAKEISIIIEKYIRKKGWSYDDFLISSFHHNELRQLKEINPEIRIGVLTELLPPGFMHFARKIGAYSVNIPVDKLNNNLVEDAHKIGLKVFTFAANNTDEIKKAKLLGVDYICSNYPDKI